MLFLPSGPNRDTLYSSINATAVQMTDSAAFQTGCQRGVIVLQGLNILTCEPLLAMAGHLAFYVDEGFNLKEGVRRCKINSLQGAASGCLAAGATTNILPSLNRAIDMLSFDSILTRKSTRTIKDWQFPLVTSLLPGLGLIDCPRQRWRRTSSDT